MKDLLNGWGVTTAVFLPLVGALVMLAIPKSEETLHKVVALVTSLAVFAVGVALMVDFDYDHTAVLQFTPGQVVDRADQQPLPSSASTASRCR